MLLDRSSISPPRGPTSEQLGRRCSGTASLLFMLAVLPVLFVALSLGVEVMNFMGLRAQLRRAADMQLIEALRQKSPGELLVSRLTDEGRLLSGHLEDISVHSSLSDSTGVVALEARYKAALSSFIENLCGRPTRAIPLRVVSKARRQHAGTMIVVDRRVLSFEPECGNAHLQALGRFTDHLVEGLGGSAADISVFITPGDADLVEPVSEARLDEGPRCRPARDGSLFDVAAIKGTLGGTEGPLDIGYAILDNALEKIFTQDFESRLIVFLVSKARYEAGDSSFLFSLLRSAVEASRLPIHALTIVLDDSQGFDNRIADQGYLGSSFREVSVSTSELEGARLVAAISRGMRDAIVVEE